MCVCVIVLSEEVDRLQMISEGMDQTVKKKCMCVNMDVSPRHRR